MKLYFSKFFCGKSGKFHIFLFEFVNIHNFPLWICKFSKLLCNKSGNVQVFPLWNCKSSKFLCFKSGNFQFIPFRICKFPTLCILSLKIPNLCTMNLGISKFCQYGFVNFQIFSNQIFTFSTFYAINLERTCLVSASFHLYHKLDAL